MGAKIIFVCAVIILLKFSTNTMKWISAKRLRAQYQESFYKDGKPFSEQIPQARKLFIDAGLNKHTIHVMESVGYGHVVSFNAIVVDNLDSKRADMVSSALELFDQLVGTYRMRMIESLSPAYWIDVVIFLPRYIVKYLGGEESGVWAKILQLAYWVLTPLFVAFRTDIYQYIADFLRKM